MIRLRSLLADLLERHLSPVWPAKIAEPPREEQITLPNGLASTQAGLMISQAIARKDEPIAGEPRPPDAEADTFVALAAWLRSRNVEPAELTSCRMIVSLKVRWLAYRVRGPLDVEYRVFWRPGSVWWRS